MKQLDVYYRALLEYRSQTQQNKNCVSDANAVIKANPDLDKIVLTRKHCIVEEDWVDTIEEGLKYVAKAIAEERQFIHANGETVPIEKVKNVSKDSVVHLAKHSNLITREIPGQDIIPDQLYTVEKLSDYAVYENKFLYMLLCYLRDFITIRYNNILKLSNTYNGTMTMNKVVKTANKTIQYSVNLAEEKRDDDYLKETNQAKEIINRIDLLLKTVLAFFSTPLMQFVSKAPMIKPPITKTNVLKMNNNFKQALNLYGYVVSYDGDGYRVETEIKEISPFNDAIAEEMSETILLSSFITYEHSLGIESALKHEYELEEQRRKEKALEEFREKIEAARLRVQKSEMSMEEYILMLEKHIRALEKKAKELDKVKKDLQETQALLEQTVNEKQELAANLERTINDLEAEKLRYITDMAAIKLTHEEEIKNLITEYEDKIAEIISKFENEINTLNEEHKQEICMLNEAHENEINELTNEHEKHIQELNDEHQKEIFSLNQSHEAVLAAKNAEISALQERMLADKAKHEAEMLRIKEEHSASISNLTAENEQLSKNLEEEIKQKRLLKAQNLSLKKEAGQLTEEDSHLTELKFDELQHTFEIFQEFYKEEWKKAKYYIRHEVLHKIFKHKKKDVSLPDRDLIELKADENISEPVQTPSRTAQDTAMEKQSSKSEAPVDIVEDAQTAVTSTPTNAAAQATEVEEAADANRITQESNECHDTSGQ